MIVPGYPKASRSRSLRLYSYRGGLDIVISCSDTLYLPEIWAFWSLWCVPSREDGSLWSMQHFCAGKNNTCIVDDEINKGRRYATSFLANFCALYPSFRYFTARTVSRRFCTLDWSVTNIYRYRYKNYNQKSIAILVEKHSFMFSVFTLLTITITSFAMYNNLKWLKFMNRTLRFFTYITCSS